MSHLVVPSRSTVALVTCVALALAVAACSSGDAQVDLAIDDARAEQVGESGAADAGGETRLGDAAPLDAFVKDSSTDGGASDLGGGAVLYSCKAVGTSSGDGFFSLAEFKGALYAGQFGYGLQAESMLYRYPPWAKVTPGLTGIGESVCALRVFGGALYANTEDSGDIFRSTDGSSWTRIHDGKDGVIGCGLAEHGGKLYAVNYDNQAATHGRVLRLDGATFTTVYDSGARALYLREIVAYAGKLYAFGVEQGQGKLLVSSNGSTWAESNAPQRFFRGVVWQGYLWLGSAALYASGKTAIWRYDGASFTEVHGEPQRSHIAALQVAHGTLFASTSNGWKGDPGPSSLLVRAAASPGKKAAWRPICSFTETAAWALGVRGGELYVGTWHYGKLGSVYHVQRQLLPKVDCAAISKANPSWEVCESGPSFCAGVFADGAGCAAFCAAVGLPCTARFGGDVGCVKEPQNPLACAAQTGHQSDWCECGVRP
jgi:hypothetical protein